MEDKTNDEGCLFPEVVELLKGAKRVEAPPDFTTRVMTSLPNRPDGVLSGLAALLFERREFSFNPVQAFRGGADREESFLYLVIMGFAHLVVFFFLAAGLKAVSLPAAPYSRWISLQPPILLFCALWFFAAAVLVLVPGQRSRKAAQVGALGYVEIMAIDVIMAGFILGRSPLLAPVLWFAALGILSGLFLLRATGRQGDGLLDERVTR